MNIQSWFSKADVQCSVVDSNHCPCTISAAVMGHTYRAPGTVSAALCPFLMPSGLITWWGPDWAPRDMELLPFIL